MNNTLHPDHPIMSSWARAGMMLTATAVLFAGTATVAAAPAQAAAPPVCAGLLPMQAQNRDMARGIEPDVVTRDSSDLSAAERWRFFPIKPGVYALISNLLNPSGNALVARVTDSNQGTKVTTTPITNMQNPREHWKREEFPGQGVTYTNLSSGKRLTYRALGGRDFEQWTIGTFNAGQFFKEVPVTCLDNTPEG